MAGTQRRTSIFLNFPYDKEFQDLFLAYVVGVCSHGLTPHTTLEIVGGEQRLRRIAKLIRSCRFSFHDLSRVEIDCRRPATPRFNMAFEAGLAAMTSLMNPRQAHTYFIFEKNPKRLHKSLSDLDGSDVYPHGGTAKGVLTQIANALLPAKRRPTVKQMLSVLDAIRGQLENIMQDVNAKTPFTARVFADLILLTNEIVKRQTVGVVKPALQAQRSAW